MESKAIIATLALRVGAGESRVRLNGVIPARYVEVVLDSLTRLDSALGRLDLPLDARALSRALSEPVMDARDFFDSPAENCVVDEKAWDYYPSVAEKRGVACPPPFGVAGCSQRPQNF